MRNLISLINHYNNTSVSERNLLFKYYKENPAELTKFLQEVISLQEVKFLLMFEYRFSKYRPKREPLFTEEAGEWLLNNQLTV